MGFEKEMSIQALNLSNNDINDAIDYIMKMQSVIIENICIIRLHFFGDCQKNFWDFYFFSKKSKKKVWPIFF